jgi:DnaJ-class molecular chaperone
MGQITCVRCDGHGLVGTWSFGVKEPDECKDCGGTGRNWQYPNGAVAQYYSGPFLGKAKDTTNDHR